jgi:hypothetical protein
MTACTTGYEREDALAGEAIHKNAAQTFPSATTIARKFAVRPVTLLYCAV